jgi:glycosyltransferase involved in cell wall biosynthesis
MRTRTWDPEFLNTPEARARIAKMREFVERQRQSILTAKVVCFPHRGFSPLGDKILDSIGVPDDRRLSIHTSNVDLLDPAPLRNNRVLIILSPCRIVYQKDSHSDMGDMDIKGTDVLLHGYTIYCRQGGTGELRLVKKGQDVTAAAALAEELGIAQRIVWLEEMSTYQLYQEMANADLICDQFGAALPGLVTTDAYALGRPVMANLRNDIFAQVYSEPFPGFDAQTPREVSDWLMVCESNRSLLIEMGKRSRAYAKRYLSPQRSAERLLERF